MNAALSGAHPPFPRVALRVGVTGHRPDRLPGPELAGRAVSALFESVGGVLSDLPPELRAVSKPERPLLRVITGLAEGADRIAAQAALALRDAPPEGSPEIELQSILAFPREEFVRDFAAAESVAEFEALLAASTAVLELDGQHGEAGEGSDQRSYEYMGEMLLRSCDLLVALWDGGPGRGRGGSVFILERAISLGVPVAWIDTRDGTTRLSTGDVGWAEFEERGLREMILRLLALPPGSSHARLGATYFGERPPGRGVLRNAWPLFRIVGVSAAGALESPEAASAGNALAADSAVAPHYAWANELAIVYANRFRSSFLIISLAAALAVLFTVIGSAVEHETRGAIASLVAIAFAIGVWVRGTRGRWHERWIDYRLMAELIRDLEALMPLGAGPPAARLPAHAGGGDPGTTWVAWHVRRIQRGMAVPSARFGPAYLQANRERLRGEWLGAQIAYHAANARFHERLNRRLGVFGFCSFLFTLVALAWFIVTDRDDLRLLEAGLPALAAWFATIRGQAESERVARRSAAMAEGLAHLRDELLRIPLAGGVVASRELVLTAEGIATTMLTELLDWRVMFASRRLELPG